MPLGVTLDPDNRWVNFSALMPWVELEETYGPQIKRTTGASEKSVRIAFVRFSSSSGDLACVTRRLPSRSEKMHTCSSSMALLAIPTRNRLIHQ